MTCAEEGFIIGCVYHVVVTPLTQGEEQRGGNQSKFSCLPINTSQISSTPTLSHSSYGPLTRTCCHPPLPQIVDLWVQGILCQCSHSLEQPTMPHPLCPIPAHVQKAP